jgi:hypothetical protein
MASPFPVEDDSLFGSGSESEDGMDMGDMRDSPFMLNDGMQFWSPIDVYLWVTTVCGVSEVDADVLLNRSVDGAMLSAIMPHTHVLCDWGVSESGALDIGKAFAEVK